ncbi:MMS19 nucleotide excision repair protein homolog [Pollicipes pollicipes]|uniref:MMS19 nucleotide excision repair protein homolog n=1 Tax=Pollicipes pollicipes TaxID=41117 RepID=UPI0018859A15|nr:MMS19 nucleotide excision repair protein homolog [Pollicipes pollicipes]
MADSECTFIAAFFCDRVRDHFSVVPAALAGVGAVVRLRHLPAEPLCRLVQSLYKEVHAQSLVLAERRCVFAALRHVLEARADDVRVLGADLVLGCVQSMEGEKDPRNLLTVFAAVRLLVAAVPLEPLAEELFEMLACYFPVDFTPPEGSAHGVTRQMLADALADVMACSGQFAEFCVPLALEKLNSDLTQAKLDAADLLVLCCRTYTGAELTPHLVPLRLALAREALAARQQEEFVRPLLERLNGDDGAEPAALTERRLAAVAAGVAEVDAVRAAVPLLLVRLVRVSRADVAATVRTLAAVQEVVARAAGQPDVADYLLTELRLPEKVLELFGAAAREVVFDPLRPQDILAVMLTKLALRKPHALTAARAAKTLAVIVNKQAPTETDHLLKTLTNQLEFLFENCEPPDAGARRPLVSLWGAIAKGLVLRGHGQAAYFVDRLDELLTAENHCVVRLLHRQWLFTVTCERLARGFREGVSARLETRAGALRCLGALARLKPHVLLPLKPQVLRELAACLDDKKRIVRQQAVEARNLWFLLGAPGGLK